MLFLSVYDIILVPICLVVMYAILRSRARACTNPGIRKLYYSAFYYKIFFVFAYTFFTEFYFSGGDTNLYYQGVKDLRNALGDNVGFIWDIMGSMNLNDTHPLAPYFIYDNYAYDFTFNYMRSPANFFIPKLALIPSLLFFNSYLCISLCFALFALGGTIRLFKLFYHYYPSAKKEIAISTLFLPSVAFWSSGLLKDSICLGCVGFFLYAFFMIVKMKKKQGISTVILLLSAFLLFTIKAYIFLVLILAVVVWLFADLNKGIREKALRQVFTIFSFAISIVAGFFILRYVTSQESLRQYQFENLVSAAEAQRYNYAVFNNAAEGATSYYDINTSNEAVLILNSFVATFYRPFVWEVNSGAAILSALEALGFLLLTAYLFIKRGVVKPFSVIFNDSKLLMSLIFAVVFAIGVGVSTANFGTLSRYKIPCLPFYLILILITYRTTGLAYPKWFRKLNNFIKI